MVTNYYNASNNFSSPIRREPKPYEVKEEKRAHHSEHPTPRAGIDNDKALLLGLLAVLYLTDCRDHWLMLALLYLALG